jgi:DNA-binding NtrC family response regulator
MRRRVLMLDAPGDELAPLRAALATATDGWGEIVLAPTRAALLERLEDGGDLVVVDYALGDGTHAGADLLRSIRGHDDHVPLIAVAERADVALASEAAAAGASDLLVRGEHLAERVATLLAKVRPVMELVARQRALHLERLADVERFRIVTRAPEMREVLDRIVRVARIPRPVLVIGERGTGKELVARAIHQASGRATGVFLAVNCAALAETLLESELFGHERGAFTGADRRVAGKFELASNGTLFLDEIAHMPLAFQQKILRVVEYGTFIPVGGSREISTSARIVAATNADLEALIEQGRFLRDLHDRLAFEVVTVPPLRERRGDVAHLAQHFLDQFLREVPALGRKRLAPSALAALERCPFPGNVRELKHVIERAAYRDTTSEITAEDIGPLNGAAAEAGGDALETRVEEYRRRLLREALEKADGNRAEAARRLGITYNQIRHYCKKYGLDSRG